MFSKKIVFYFLFYVVIQGLWAQDVSVYPDYSTVFESHLGILNPAINSSHSENYAFFSSKLRSGPLNKVASHFLSIEKKFKPEKNGGHLLRINLINENEGPYIQRTRIYGGYAYKIILTREWDFALGTNLGYAGAFYSAPSATSIDNANSADASFGISSKWKEFKFGFSYQQMLNAKFSKDNLVRLTPYYVGFFQYEKKISPKGNVNAYVVYNVFQTKGNVLLVKGNYIWSDLLGAALILHSRNGLSFEGMIYPKFKEYNGTIAFVYNANAFSQKNAVFRSYELCFGLDF